MNGRNSSDSNTSLHSDEETKKLDEFNKFNDFFLEHISRESIHREKDKNRIVLVESIEGNNCKDNLEKSTWDKKEKKESFTYKYIGLGLMVGICSYLALNDSRISIALSAIATISSWLIFNKNILHENRFFTQKNILKDGFSNGRKEAVNRSMQRI